MTVTEQRTPQQLSENTGLTQARAERLLDLNGRNVIGGKKNNSAAKIFAGQFRDLMVMILLLAAGASVAIGEYTDAIPIMLIVIVNAVLGFIQEYRAEKTLEHLAELTAPTARVWRDGRLVTIPADKLVTGDIIELEAGNRVPADCLIISSTALSCDESILTGETLPAEKRAYNEESKVTGLDLPYMVYMGTVCLKGRARAEVTATGSATQMGAVSSMIENTEEDLTPLQKKLGELGKVLAIICIGVCIVVFIAGVLRGEPIPEMLMTAISIAVAAIPEGLPAAVTIALALAVRRMLSRKALVSRLHSVETLGCASVICTDKTGTLTMNKMTVRKITLCGESIRELTFSDKDVLTGAEGEVHPWDDKALGELLCCAAVCNNARLVREDVSSKRDRGGEISGMRAEGDPTEAAILTAAVKGGIDAESFRRFRIDEEPFDSTKKYMTVTITADGTEKIYKKGAPDVLLNSCGYVFGPDGKAQPLGEAVRGSIYDLNERYAADGMRVLAFSVSESGREVFIGLMAMSDPLRPEAKKAVKECARAGIRTIMITGDHKLTACTAAREAGILCKGMSAVTGAELDNMDDEKLDSILDTTAVYARVSPEHKLRIVRAFKRRGKVCAMTGDGVNDAPAVKEASIGVSMGISGTDVTKQAADCVLLDDNFATLVAAVREGRTIYRNIRKFVRYLIACNIGEVLTMLGGIVMGLPLVLLPSQILLVNLVTDGLPAIALGAEPSEKDIMDAPPRRESESFFSGGLLWRMLIRGALIGTATLASFTVLLTLGAGLTAARTGALVTLVLSQLIHAIECRSEKTPLFRQRPSENPFLIISLMLSFGCMLICMFVPYLAGMFSLLELTVLQWMICTVFSVLPAGIALLFGRY